MSAEARLQGQIADAVRQATEPLEARVAALSARLDAVEGADEARGATPAKRAAGGRTAKARAQAAEATATAGDTSAGTVPEQRKGDDA